MATSLSTYLPDELLREILRRLSAEELAAASMQDKKFRDLSQDSELWEVLCVSRWPLCGAQPTGTKHTLERKQCAPAALQKDDWRWRRLYAERASLPPGVASLMDKCHFVCSRTGGKRTFQASNADPACATGADAAAMHRVLPARTGQLPFLRVAALVFEGVMRLVFGVGVLAAESGRGAGLGGGRDARRYLEDVAWWLEEHDKVVFGFASYTVQLLLLQFPVRLEAGNPGGAAVPISEVLWRRSALQFLLDLELQPQGGAGKAVLARLHRECGKMDVVLRLLPTKELPTTAELPGVAEADAAGAAVLALPPSHWWYSQPRV